MKDPWEVLLSGEPAAGCLPALQAILGAQEAATARRLEAALPDLLREPNEALLSALIDGLAPLAGSDPAARRVLELLSRRPGGPSNQAQRAVALRALRGAGAGVAPGDGPEDRP